MIFGNKKFGLLAMTIVFVFISIFGVLFAAPKKVQAMPVEVTTDAPMTTFMTKFFADNKTEEVKVNTKEKMLLMAIGAVTNGLNYFANKIAYDMGVWLASGDWGQGPFASSKSFKDYLAQTAGDALGEIIGSMGDMLGMDLCNLPDLRLQLALQLGFHFGADPPTPRCTWQQLREAYNIDNIRSQYASQEGLMNRIEGGISVKDTDFGIWFAAKQKVDNYAVEVEGGKSLDRQEGDGIFPMNDIISGKTKVPATVMQDEFKAQSPSTKKKNDSDVNTAAMGMAVQKGGIQLLTNTAATFVNTLLGTVIDNFITKGMLPGGKVICNPGLSISGLGWNMCLDDESAAGDYYSAGSAGGTSGQRRAAQEMFSELLMPKISTIENYDPTGNLAECSPDNFAPDACVVDQSFLQILSQATYGQPLTIKQAIEQGLLHGDWKLYSADNEAMNQKFDCALEAYCNRNLRMLRLLRIMPLGLEIASSYSTEGNEATLKEVVDAYYDETSKFYHLVNPYWIIKYPKTRCGSFAYSAVNYTDSPVRLQYCADIQHCVKFNADGSCANWGYCLREKPIWSFDADYCDEQYNSCLAFTASDKTTGSYLLRTLDTVSCNEENDGCRRYSQVEYYDTATSTDWFPAMAEYQVAHDIFFNTSLFFNKKVATCNSADDGCSAFKLASNPDTLIYLRKAPDYLGCYDADSSTGVNKIDLINKKLKNGIQWPLTFSDLNLINPQNEEACNQYAQVCLPEEENCNFYTSVLTREVIPGKFTPAVVEGGIVTWNDQCDFKCVGYDAYREMPSNYTNGELITYIIPSSGRTCTAEESGCSSFTNLSTTAGGLEQNEYFTYLRPCMLPDQNLQRNYTVYERSETKGYEIKTYTLAKSDESNGPKQIYRDGAEMDKYTAPDNAYCSEESYDNKTAEPDCHQFIDEFGDTHYAMLSKTLIVTDQCTPYRLNNTELISYESEAPRCPFDFDNGEIDNHTGDATVEFRSNACFYMGFTGNTNGAGNSIACSAESNSCRSFKGNAGYNVRKIVDEDFEYSTTTVDWKTTANMNAAISTESTQLDGHSLKITAESASVGSIAGKINLPLKQGKNYVLSFWAKGNLAINKIALWDASAMTEQTLSPNTLVLSDVWRYYSLGPAEYNGEDILSGELRFTFGNNIGQVYIDNIILTEVDDYLYLVKDTLSVDPICDSNTNDNLPGEALGCSAYIDPAQTNYYLTNFNYLCREAAVGCTALIDTFNTPEDATSRAYNVWLELGSYDPAITPGTQAKATIEGELFECFAPTGQTGCYVDVFDKTAAQIFNGGGVSGDNAKPKLVDSTIFIPADTPSSTPIYLVANKAATCKSENMGCQVVGRATTNISGKSYDFDFFGNPTALFTHYETFDAVGIKNDPALYESMSCFSEAESCKSWSSNQSNYYFKDPVTNGGLICEYKTEAFTAIHLPATLQAQPHPITDLSAHANSTGWVWKDTGICILEDAGLYMGRACTADSDCNNHIGEGKCMFKNQLPCYAENKFFGVYGLWSFGNTEKYTGFVGLCPEEQSGCNEFVDWSSTQENKKCSISGKKCNADSDCVTETDGYCVVNTSNAYYLIDNTKLSEAQSKCNGQISRAEGCVLLDKTGNPNKFWHTTSSYEASRELNDALVAPVSLDGSNDANIIIKVTQDRVCGEWAYCDLKQEFEDEDSGEIKNRCYHLGVCNRAGAVDTVAGRVVKDCAEPATDWDTKGETLSKDYYQDLMTSWDSWDFSGYSIFNTYQVPDLTARKIDGTYRLVYVNNEYSFLNKTSVNSCYDDGDPHEQKDDGDQCGPEGTWGYCYNGECLKGYSATNPTQSRVLTCRAYAEEISPFRSSVLIDYERGKPFQYKTGFEGVNLCYSDNGNPVSCDYDYYCSYRKLKTDSGDVYKRISKSESMSGNYICSSGPYKGMFCTDPETTTQCGEGGICSKINSFQVMNGWLGYCTERDERQRIYGSTSNACLTWLPLEYPPGIPNYWEQDPNAGYEILEGAQDRFMCLENEILMRYDNEKDSRPYQPEESDPSGYTPIMRSGVVLGIDSVYGYRNQYTSVQVFPKNNAYKWYTVNTSDQKFALTNLPQNTTISGCFNPSARIGGGDTAEDGGYEYGFAIYDSSAIYCPINKNTLIIDGDSGSSHDGTMARCSANAWDWNYESSMYKCDEWNPWNKNGESDTYFHMDQQEWLPDSYVSKYIHRYEIERIDVWVDKSNPEHLTGEGWVSFIRDAVDADANEDTSRSFVVETKFYSQVGENSISTPSLDELGLTGWTAWQFYTGSGNSNWDTSGEATSPGNPDPYSSDKMSIVSAADADDFQYVTLDSTDPNDKNIGIRVVWDDKNYLRGIWLNGNATDDDADGIGDSDGNNGMDVGFFFVIHFTHGKCKKFAQVSSQDGALGSFKPYANRLVTDTVIKDTTDDTDSRTEDDPYYYDQYVYTVARTADVNGGKYGLAYGTEGGYTDILTLDKDNYGASFINPFTFYRKIPKSNTGVNFYFSQNGDVRSNYVFTGYRAGVPLVSNDSVAAKNQHNWYNYTSPGTSGMAGSPYRDMIEKMFAKVINIWTLKAGTGADSGFNDGYESTAGYDAAKPNNAETITGFYIFPPHVAAPSGDSWELDKISVNGTTSGNIYLFSGSQTRIKFYAWAHGNQMPLRQVVVDKGDGFDTRVDSGLSDSIGNRKPVCSEDKTCGSMEYQSQFSCNSNSDCVPGLGSASCVDISANKSYYSFGNTTDTGCKAKPWDFVMDYNCPYGTMEIVMSNKQPDTPISGRSIDWNYIRQNFYNAPYVCVARPKVHVLDNWGWCTGSCGNESLDSVWGGDGCYSEMGSDGTTNQCNINNLEPWIYYDGWVVVVPMTGS